MALTIDTFEEQIGSRRGNSTEFTRKFTAIGRNGTTPMSETELSSFVNSQIGVHPDIPITMDGLGINDASYDEVSNPVTQDANPSKINGHYEVTFTWNIPGEISRRFNFQAQGGHFVQSLQTISAWGPGQVSVTGVPLNLAGAKLPNFQGAINVVPQQDGPAKVEGFDVAPPAETHTITYAAYESVITPSYRRLIYNLCGKVNSVTFDDNPPGTTMLVRVNGERRLAPLGHLWTIEFGFGYVPNLASGSPLVIGDNTDLSLSKKIVITQKDGLDLLWIYRDAQKEDNYHSVFPLPIAAYVERVWPRADLNALNLPGLD